MALKFRQQHGNTPTATRGTGPSDISFSEGLGAFGRGLSGSSGLVEGGFKIADAFTAGRIGEANAALFMRENNAARIASRERIRDVRRSFAFLQGSQVAGFGAAGVLLEGSALDVVADTAGELKRSVLREEWNLEVTVLMNNYRAAVASAVGRAAKRRLLVQGALSIVRGGVGAAGAFG